MANIIHIDRLEKNIQDQVIEAQIKLGYISETMRLYYPLDSLNAMLETDIETTEKMCVQLTERTSVFSFSVHQDRIEVNVPAEYVSYVYETCDKPKFLVKLITLFQNHHLNLEQVQDVFGEFGRYICRKMPEEADFDYVLYFEDESVDEYYYCIKMEMDHLIYHRFSKADYYRFVQ